MLVDLNFNGRIFIYIALIFSTLGDVFLMLEGQTSFLAGVGMFALAHVFYMLYFKKHFGKNNKLLNYKLLTFVVLYGYGLIYLIYDYLDGLKPYVISYALIIMSMLYCSFLTKGILKTNAFWVLMIGSILFVISDSLLALNMFGYAFNKAGFWVMLTYILAQFFIIQSVVLQYGQPQSLYMETDDSPD